MVRYEECSLRHYILEKNDLHGAAVAGAELTDSRMLGLGAAERYLISRKKLDSVNR